MLDFFLNFSIFYSQEKCPEAIGMYFLMKFYGRMYDTKYILLLGKKRMVS